MSFTGFLSKLPVVGNLFPSDEAEAHKANLAATSRMYTDLQPEYAQAMLNAQGNTMGAYRGYNNYLAAMYGQGAVPRPIIANPMSPRMMGLSAIRSTSTGGDAGSIGGGMAAGAAKGAVAGAPLGGVGAPVGAVVGGVLGGLAGATTRGSIEHAAPPPFAAYHTYPRGK